MPRTFAADYSPTITSPRGVYPPLAPGGGSAPSAVSALSAAASETFSAALSAAKLNLQRRRRQTLSSRNSSSSHRTPYLDDEEAGASEQPQQQRHRPLTHSSSQPSTAVPRFRNQPRPLVSKSASASSASNARTTPFATVLSMPSTSSRTPPSASGRSSFASARSSPSASSATSSASHQYDEASMSSLPSLSAERRQALVAFLDRSVDDAYNLSRGFGRVRWTPSRTREGVAIHRARGADDAPLAAAVRGCCNVSASFRELRDLLVTESTADFAELEATVNPLEFLDGRVLHVLEPRDASRNDRFACVKWHCVRSLAPSVAKHRDYVYAELVDEFTDGEGRRVGFRLCKSVELEELPAKDTAQLFVRAKTLTLQTWSERAPGSLEFVTMLINDLGERLPAWLVHKIVDTAAMRSACVRDHINQRRLDVLVRAAPRGLVPLNRRICCVVCTRSFSLVRKKYNCAACGDVICASCSVHQLVTTQQRLSDAAAPGGKRKARICVQCSSTMRTTELPRRASAATRTSSEDGSGRTSIASNSNSSSRGTALMAQRASTNGSILMTQRVSMGKRSDEYRRSFVSDGGTGSLDSTASSDDSGGSVHPTGPSSSATVAKGGRKTQVPNMFQFRGLSTSMGASERSSKASTSPSSPGDDTVGDALLSLEVEELQPQLLGDSILSAALGPAELLDLDVGQYKSTPSRKERDYEAEAAELAEYSDSEEDEDDAGNFLHTEQLEVVRQSLSQATVVTLDMDAPTVHKVEVASFLTAEENASLDVASDDSDSASFLTVDENSRIVRSQDSASFGRKAGVTGAPVAVQVEELIVEELIVEEILPENAGSVPRRSIETEEVEVPMVVRKVAKRMLGSVGRRSRERRAAAPRPPGAPPAPPAVEDVLADSLASASEAAKDSQAAPPPTPEEETLKLADLQVHLDRMDQISASLRDLRQGMKETTEAPASTQSAMAALTTFETKANAERAAKIAANFISLLDRQAAPAARRAQQYLKQRGGPRTSLFNLTLAMGDGSFVDYLADSTFEDVGESPDGAGFGWQAVLSRTTGKQYFFNQSCALASWTLPGPDTFRGTLYMVL